MEVVLDHLDFLSPGNEMRQVGEILRCTVKSGEQCDPPCQTFEENGKRKARDEASLCLDAERCQKVKGHAFNRPFILRIDLRWLRCEGLEVPGVAIEKRNALPTLHDIDRRQIVPPSFPPQPSLSHLLKSNDQVRQSVYGRSYEDKLKIEGLAGMEGLAIGKRRIEDVRRGSMGVFPSVRISDRGRRIEQSHINAPAAEHAVGAFILAGWANYFFEHCPECSPKDGAFIRGQDRKSSHLEGKLEPREPEKWSVFLGGSSHVCSLGAGEIVSKHCESSHMFSAILTLQSIVHKQKRTMLSLLFRVNVIRWIIRGMPVIIVTTADLWKMDFLLQVFPLAGFFF